MSVVDANKTPNAAPAIDYCTLLAHELGRVTGNLVAVYLHGSACLGGWNASASDVDVLIVVEDTTDRQTIEAMVAVLNDSFPGCPGRGLECSIVTRDAVEHPHPPWLYLAHVSSDADDPSQAFPQDADGGDPDLLMHYAVCRCAGIVVNGPSASELIGEINRKLVLAYLADELIWGLEHAPAHYALLNACRAREYLEHHRIVSKIEAGEQSLGRPGGPHAEIRAALTAQRGGTALPTLSEEAADFVRELSCELRNAADC